MEEQKNRNVAVLRQYQAILYRGNYRGEGRVCRWRGAAAVSVDVVQVCHAATVVRLQ